MTAGVSAKITQWYNISKLLRKLGLKSLVLMIYNWCRMTPDANYLKENSADLIPQDDLVIDIRAFQLVQQLGAYLNLFI